ncbi:MAG TPA: type II toxin-antitoxin system RelE/ParE family toxin [Bryobacteraceae bacterium]|nr:type II toxin-antitoxin system RelE/ParE family toxin [Bryobacterales bacterium]HRJ20361.1 type II toxin-antitoxin system RelE/ParE family toxin [Bryobacteraceae bacterium]
MPKPFKREAARRDLVAQWVWYAEHADSNVADRFLAAAESALDLLAQHPRSGRRLFLENPRLQELRYFLVGGGFDRVLLVYAINGNTVELIRVLHSSREIERLFDEGGPEG